MKKIIIWIVGIALLAGLIAGASTLYNKLSDDFGGGGGGLNTFAPTVNETTEKPVGDTEKVENNTSEDISEETDKHPDINGESTTDAEDDSASSSDTSTETETETEIKSEETTETETETETSTPEIIFQGIDFTVTDMNGKSVKLSDMKGKIIVVNFWATWCTYCKMEMPDFQEMYEKYGDEIVFMMVNSGETAATAKAYIEKEGYTFPVYLDLNQSATAAYGVTAFPTTFFLDENGRGIAWVRGAINSATIEQGIAMVKEH